MRDIAVVVVVVVVVVAGVDFLLQVPDQFFLLSVDTPLLATAESS